MLETPHVALGAAIAVAVPNPLVSIPLAFASHFVLDMVPHWNPHFYTETQIHGRPTKLSTLIAVSDELVAIGLTLYIAYYFLPDYQKSISIMACAFASVLSDQIKFPYFYFKMNGLIKRWVLWERKIQVEIEPFWGILTQIIVTGVSLYWIF